MDEMKTIIKKAIANCSTQSAKKPQDGTALLKSCDTAVHSLFRNSIANGIARYLLNHYGVAIKNIKLYGSTMEFSAGKYSDIDIVIHVGEQGKEILKDLKKINRILTKEYYRLIGETPDDYSYLLDAHIIDESSKNQRDPSFEYLNHILAYESIAILN